MSNKHLEHFVHLSKERRYSLTLYISIAAAINKDKLSKNV